MKGIYKAFPGVVANTHVDLSVERGSVHALVGENGAGKSTLMRILYGLYAADAGEIWLDGKKLQVSSPQDAIRAGIGMVHQEFQLVPSLTVAENITLGYEPRQGFLVDRRSMRREVVKLSEQFGLRVDPDAILAGLSVGAQQRVEILKLLYRQAQLLILDEPTAVLTPQETESLFDVLNRLVANGRTVIFITHKLKEVMALCQRATVLRRGQVVGNVEVAETDAIQITNLMMGHQVNIPEFELGVQGVEEVLSLQEVRAYNDRGLLALKGISLKVHRGEIVAIAGVEGNGQSELLEVLVGIRPMGGQILLRGRDIRKYNPRRRRELGLALIPEDRRHQGVNLNTTIAENIVSNRYYKPPYAHFGVLNPRSIQKAGQHALEQFNIKAEDGSVTVGTLSGGNAQKVIIARELAEIPALLVAAQPTRGLDVEASIYVRSELVRMKDSQAAVLLISADLDEIIQVSDRILVMFEGQFFGELAPSQASYETLGLMMAGRQPTVGQPAEEPPRG
jgi:simple sugar transport system ATP-binding protein